MEKSLKEQFYFIKIKLSTELKVTEKTWNRSISSHLNIHILCSISFEIRMKYSS